MTHHSASPLSARAHGWHWVPTLYFAQGLPYVAVMTIAVILYKRLGLGNAEIALYTSWLYLPWIIKPLWSPFVDLLRTKRWWIVTMQALVGAALAGVAFFLPTGVAIQATLACFWLMAFASATNDIATDGFYMLALDPDGQSFFVGIRNTFYRLATIFGQGLLVMAAGWLELRLGRVTLAWSLAFYALAALFIGLTLFHRRALPRPAADVPATGQAHHVWQGFVQTFVSFFRKAHAGEMFFFLLAYRLGESQLAKIITPFLLDSREHGGLGLDTATVGLAYGTVGVAALLAGGIAGGYVVSRSGLRRWLLPMALAINVPDLLYVWMAAAQPTEAGAIVACVAAEQLGYGFGFTAYTLYLMHVAQGPCQTAHYAIGTGFMALGMMLPGMPAGWLQEQMGYTLFFAFVCLCTLPGIAAAWMVRRRLGARPAATRETATRPEGQNEG